MIRGWTDVEKVSTLPSVSGLKRIPLKVIQNWVQADGFGLSAALSFYAMFSLAPILVFSVLLASHFLGASGAQEGAQKWLEGFVSGEEAKALLGLVNTDHLKVDGGWVTTVLTGVMFLWAASLTFVRLRISVNRLLGLNVPDMKQAVKNSLIGRVHAVTFTIGSGLVMALGIWVIMAMSTIPLPDFGDLSWLPIAISHLSAGLLIVVGSVLIIRMLPVRAPSWKSMWIGVLFILFTFEVGRLLLNLYLKHSGIVSAYGAASTLVVFLVWIYYTSQAFLLGVAITGVLDDVDET
ncbi:YihY/virulence factor BrkB family protein [Rubellicoccus peritrichatus]|uniref:YihY/virulence factor BrkB family protein n=1 Tax=Rubellicoccus peritrichatus TaxID=3080537 RepID=A0AAQ3L9J5_9BACT|nr:YihY/virulence factor BrkB family protein [Puniceicoccus sp. CR14]WOO42134.1 YihY/virulence factor BrkB family protein [Puniceicoccus sp. CR14]